jgi:hypothetical protein
MWCQIHGLIPDQIKCKCSENMAIRKRSDITDCWGWRCTKCSGRKRIKFNSFFEDFDTSIVVILKYIVERCKQTRIVDLKEEVGKSRQTVTAVYPKNVVRQQYKIRLE